MSIGKKRKKEKTEKKREREKKRKEKKIEKKVAGEPLQGAGGRTNGEHLMNKKGDVTLMHYPHNPNTFLIFPSK